MATKKPKKEYSNTPKVTEPIKNQIDETETFLLINQEGKWRIGLNGMWATKKVFENQEQAQKYINSKPYDLIMNLAGMIAEYIINNKKQ